jgi:choline dehydrogenase-like flavoprotein
VILDANRIDNGARLKADVCIVGGGAAGISLALALTGQGLDIVLLESGHHHLDAATQSLYDGEVADDKLHSPPDKYRQRRLGGSTGIWGGRCMPFDPIDFEKREWVPGSGWPISYGDLAPFYPEANKLSEAGRFAYTDKEAFDAPAMFQGFESSEVRTDGLERFSCPTNFGERYARRLHVSSDIRVLLGANCTALKLVPHGRTLRGVEVTTLGGRRFFVDARTTVLASGGLETPRLLLASNDIAPAGIGNEHDVVGRYYMCHIAGNVGSLVVNGPASCVRHGYEISPEGIYCRRRISLHEDAQRRHGVANAVARLHFPRITDPRHRNGVLSGLFLARKFISYEYAKRLNDGTPPTLGLHARHLWNVIADPLDTCGFLAHWVAKRTLADRKFPSVILRNRSNRFSLEMHGEQAPRAHSRVTVTDNFDALGLPKLRVDWNYGSDDIESVRRTLDVIAAEMKRAGVGELTYDADTLEEDLMRFGAYGGHHIGTARMGDDPRTSVVDANCRVHSVNNLFVAGSAVFPTSSQANPTLTLIAMSLRLGKHLAQRLSRKAVTVLEEAVA